MQCPVSTETDFGKLRTPASAKLPSSIDCGPVMAEPVAIFRRLQIVAAQ
jgi:hypothetical protein